MTDLQRTPWLHIRGQFTFHAEATIHGTVAGLKALRGAIDEALDLREGHASVYATDGEGYRVRILRCNTLGGLGEPTYADEEAREIANHERKYLLRTNDRRQQEEAYQALRWCKKHGNPHHKDDDNDQAG